MRLSKRDRILTLSLLIPAVGIFLWTHVSMYWNKTTCAKILYLKHARGYYVCFIYDRNGNVVEDRANISSFKYKNIKDLQQKQCCEIKYSIYWPYRVEITDKDLKAE